MESKGSRRTCRAALVAGFALAAFAVFAMSAAATPSGRDYGPDTCLNGFVWRDAAPGDHVCVTPDVRAQAADDNAHAAERSTEYGPFGPNTCMYGLVWRAAFVGDQVCVDPANRDQAIADNAQAAARRNDVRTALGIYLSGGARRYAVRTDRINAGLAIVILFRIDGKALRSWRALASPSTNGGPGGYLSLRTGAAQCHGPANGYFRVEDGTSGRWSSRQYVTTGCSTL
jgi:hypothetical protein